MNKSIETPREKLYRAAISCGHSITKDSITLHRDTSKPGNALAQLADRLLAAAAEAPAAHPDDIAVDRFAAAMKEKMAKSRAKGRAGWDDPAICSIESLQQMLIDHIEKGDPVDIGNFAMMIHQRGAAAAAPSASAPIADAYTAIFNAVGKSVADTPGLHAISISVQKLKAALLESGYAVVPVAKPTIHDHVIAQTVNDLTEIAQNFHGAQQLRERIAHVVVPPLRAAINERERAFEFVRAQSIQSITSAAELNALRAVFDYFNAQKNGLPDAPGHCHIIPGTWDSGGGNKMAGKAGKPCEWCATWNKAKDFTIPARAAPTPIGNSGSANPIEPGAALPNGNAES